MGVARHRRLRNRQRGIVLVAVCLFLLAMVAGLGLGVDLNRLWAAQQSLNAATEAAALAAALELDGTPVGLERARTKAAASAPGIAEFALSADGPWNADPLSATGLTAVRVSASQTMPLTLLRTVTGYEAIPVRAATRVAQVEREAVEPDMLPFAMALPSGDLLPLGRAERKALRDLIGSDSDPWTQDFAAYIAARRGNGRRLVPLAIVDSDRRVTGFAAYFLGPASEYQDTATALRAERAGGFLEGSRSIAADAKASGIWRVEVIR